MFSNIRVDFFQIRRNQRGGTQVSTSPQGTLGVSAVAFDNRKVDKCPKIVPTLIWQRQLLRFRRCEGGNLDDKNGHKCVRYHTKLTKTSEYLLYVVPYDMSKNK